VNLTEFDDAVRHLFPIGMRSATDLKLELRCGFELFNTRPYHNYETWSNGWYATASDKVVASGETLEDLCASLMRWATNEHGHHSFDGPHHISYRTWRIENGFHEAKP
jgi:hypothetical protein